MTEQQLAYNLPFEFHDFLTEEKSKYFFDYSVREVLRDESGQPTEMNLLACATLKSTVESYRTMLRRAGFRLRVLTPASALTAPCCRPTTRRTRQEGRDLCVVNLGHSATFLYIYRGGHFASRREIEVGCPIWSIWWPISAQRGRPRGSRVCAPELQPCAGVGAGP